MDSIGHRMIVSGRVQGVGFRYFAWRSAAALGLTGFARNLPDGTVEVYPEGPRAALEQLRSRLREGPRSAKVTQVVVQEQLAGGRYASFSIEH